LEDLLLCLGPTKVGSSLGLAVRFLQTGRAAADGDRTLRPTVQGPEAADQNTTFNIPDVPRGERLRRKIMTRMVQLKLQVPGARS
jgi:hypothetical protein